MSYIMNLVCDRDGEDGSYSVAFFEREDGREIAQADIELLEDKWEEFRNNSRKARYAQDRDLEGDDLSEEFMMTFDYEDSSFIEWFIKNNPKLKVSGHTIDEVRVG
jgi:hypothetical protein